MIKEDPTQSSFHLGELVLARSPTLPFWPAFIQLCESKEDELEGKWRTQLSDGTDSRYWCVFVNTKDCATWVSVALVKKFSSAGADTSIRQCRAANMKERLTTAIQKAIELRDANTEKSVTAVLKPVNIPAEQSIEGQDTTNASSRTAHMTDEPEAIAKSSDATNIALNTIDAKTKDIRMATKQSEVDVAVRQSNAEEDLPKATMDSGHEKSGLHVMSAEESAEKLKDKEKETNRLKETQNSTNPGNDVEMIVPNELVSPPHADDSTGGINAVSPVTTRSRAGVVHSNMSAQTLAPAASASMGLEMASQRNILPLPGDLVLAKTGTYPFWPAIVSRCESEKKSWNNQWVLLATNKRPLRVWCSFVGDTTGGWVPLDKVRPYNPKHAEEFLKSQNARMFKDQKLAIALANEMHDSKKRLKTYPATTPVSHADIKKIESPHTNHGESNNQGEVRNVLPDNDSGNADLKYRLGDIVLAKYDHSCPYWPAVIEKCSEVKEDEGEDKSLLGKWHRKAVGNISDRYCCLFVNDGSESWVTVEIIVPFTVHRAKRFLLPRNNELYEPQRVAIEQAAVMHKKRGNSNVDVNWAESDVVLAGFQNAYWPAVIKTCGESEDSSYGQWKKTDEKGQSLYWCAFLLNSTFEWVPPNSLKPFTAARARHYFVSKHSKYYKYQKDAISLATKLVEGKVFGDDVIDVEEEDSHKEANPLSYNVIGHVGSAQGHAGVPATAQAAVTRHGNTTTEEEECYVQYGIVLVRLNHTTYWPARIEPCPEDPEQRWTLPDEGSGMSKFWCNLLNHSASKWSVEEELKPFKPHRARRYMYRKTSAEIHDQRKAVKMATELQKKPEAYRNMFNIPAPVKEQESQIEKSTDVVESQNVSDEQSAEIRTEVKEAETATVSRACVTTDPQIKELLMAKVSTEKECAFKAFERRKRPSLSDVDTLHDSPRVKLRRTNSGNLDESKLSNEVGKSTYHSNESNHSANAHTGNTAQNQEVKQPSGDAKNLDTQAQKEIEKHVRDSGSTTGKRMRVEVVVASGSVKKHK